MKLSKLIRELSITRDKIKFDPEVHVCTSMRFQNDFLGQINSIEVSGIGENIKLILNGYIT